MTQRALLGLATCVLLAACLAQPERGSGDVMNSAQASDSAECFPAESHLVDVVAATLVARDFSLSRTFQMPAGHRSSSGASDAPALSSATWFSAFINGAGIRPVVGVWLVDQGGSGSLWSVDATTRRYSTAPALGWSGDSSELVRLRNCVGPVPES